MSFEHMDGAEIWRIDIENAVGTSHDGQSFAVGWKAISAGAQWSDKVVTRIEAFTKSGMYSDLPYVRVWCGDSPVAEFCQHNIVGIYFKAPAQDLIS